MNYKKGFTMKDINTIKKDSHIICIERDVENDEIIQLKFLMNLNNKIALVKFTKALGWEHASISFEDVTPTWEETQKIKELFWKDTEVCYQLHPAKDNYINNHEHCLHIWRNLNQEVLTPPPTFVGFRLNHLQEDFDNFIKIQEQLNRPLSENEFIFYKMYINYLDCKNNNKN